MMEASPRVSNQWRSQVNESAIEPELAIIDAHHHVWDVSPSGPQFDPYPAEDYFRDIVESGHNVIGSVYVEARSSYRAQGPEALRVVGETVYANAIAERARRAGGRLAGICAG